MVIKPFVYKILAHAVILLILGALLPKWWSSKDRIVSLVDMRDATQEGGKTRWQVQPLSQPATWAAAGQTVRASALASVILLVAALLLARSGGPHAIGAWLAVAATLLTLVAAIAFVVLRPELGALRPGLPLIAMFLGSVLGLLGALGLARAG